MDGFHSTQPPTQDDPQAEFRRLLVCPRFNRWITHVSKNVDEQYGWTDLDWEDIRQHLLTKLWDQISDYDPQKSPLDEHLSVAVNHSIVDLVRQQNAKKRRPDRPALSIHEILPADEEDCGWGELHPKAGCPHARRAQSDRQGLEADLKSFRSDLNERQKSILDGIAEGGLDWAKNKTGLSTYAVRNQRRELRELLTEAGFEDYLS